LSSQTINIAYCTNEVLTKRFTRIYFPLRSKFTSKFPVVANVSHSAQLGGV